MVPAQIPNCFYRVSIKALVTKDGKLLLLQESDGRWNLPGGGLEHNETLEECLTREIDEEIGVKVNSIGKKPVYIWSYLDSKGYGVLHLCYQVKLNSTAFKKIDEAIDAKFFNQAEIEQIEKCADVKKLVDVLDLKDFQEF